MIRENFAVSLLASLLLFSFAVGFSSVLFVEANFLYPPLDIISIGSDGTVSPSTAPIRRVEDVYTFTGNVTNSVIDVQRDNIIIDGGGYSMVKSVPAWGSQDAVALKGMFGVTVKNLYAYGFSYGVLLSGSSGCVVSNNSFGGNKFGVILSEKASGNLVSGNSFVSGGGIAIYNSVNNVLRENSMVGSGPNFWVDSENVESASNFVNDIDGSNTVNGRPVCYWVNQTNRAVPVDAGYVALVNCSRITVGKLNLSNNGQGVLLISSRDSQIVGNSIVSNDKGIAIYDSVNNSILGNDIANNTFGIVTYSRPNTFSSNRLDNNTNDVNFEDRFVDEFDYSNVVDGTPICYWLWKKDRVVPEDVGYVVLLSCKNITVQNLNITHRRQGIVLVEVFDSAISRNIVENNDAGIVMRGSVNNRILGNLVANNSAGIRLEASNSCEVSGNKIVFNANLGIQLDDCNYNTFVGNYLAHSKVGFTINRGGSNVVSGNSILYTKEKGFHLGESVDNLLTGNNIAWSNGRALTITGSVGDNRIHHNDFINNVGGDPFQAYPGGSTFNIWDDGSQGNFWSDYQSKYPLAKQLSFLEIWDTPVSMNDNNRDRYPLTEPVDLKYQITVLRPVNRIYNSTSSVPLAFFATAAVSWMGYSLDTGANVTFNGDIALMNLPVGKHQITVYAGDRDGDICASETVFFEVGDYIAATPTIQPTEPAHETPQPTINTSQPSPSPSSTQQPISTTKTATPSAPANSENSPSLLIVTSWLFLVLAATLAFSAAALFIFRKRK